MNRFVIALLLACSVGVYGQDPKAPTPKPEEAVAVSEADSKELANYLDMFQLSNLAVQSARREAISSDPVASRAAEILEQAIASVPKVKEAVDATNRDRQQAAIAIEAMKKKYKLTPESAWDYNFTEKRFYKLTAEQQKQIQQQQSPTPVPPAAPVKPKS